MGSALFLLGRLTDEFNPVERAADSFGKALSIYDAFGATRLAKVSERNLSRAEDVLSSRQERRVQKFDWEDGYRREGHKTESISLNKKIVVEVAE